MAAPAELELSANGIDFAALAWGDEAAPLVLCLHGYPDTAWTWRHVAPRLAAEGRRVVAPFMRGYAPTGLAPGGSYGVGALARDAVALRDALGGGEDAALVGHDWGAVTTYVVAAEFSRAVTLAVPPVGVLLNAPARLALPQLRSSWYMFFQQLPRVSEAALPRLIARLWADWSPGYDATDDVRRTREALADPAHATAALEYYRAFRRDLRRRRSNVSEPRRKPVLYLHGDRDGCVLPALAARAARELPAGSRFELVEGAGHFLQLEAPDTVFRLVSDWLGANRAEAPAG